MQYRHLRCALSTSIVTFALLGSTLSPATNGFIPHGFSPKDKGLASGYSHTEQPVPDSEVVFNILAPGVIEDMITFGFTKATARNAEWNFNLMYAPGHSVKGRNTFDQGQEIEFEMTQFQAGLGYARLF